MNNGGILTGDQATYLNEPLGKRIIRKLWINEMKQIGLQRFDTIKRGANRTENHITWPRKPTTTQNIHKERLKTQAPYLPSDDNLAPQEQPQLASRSPTTPPTNIVGTRESNVAFTAEYNNLYPERLR